MLLKNQVIAVGSYSAAMVLLTITTLVAYDLVPGARASGNKNNTRIN